MNVSRCALGSDAIDSIKEVRSVIDVELHWAPIGPGDFAALALRPDLGPSGVKRLEG
jgi:hypothetical protein